ncbi:MAG: DUF938 domain-containing protein [Proteobacteria bacterium]|nr:MAG: DUF938 domain-containing protein [Pseudomonadota bacterium]
MRCIGITAIDWPARPSSFPSSTWPGCSLSCWWITTGSRFSVFSDEWRAARRFAAITDAVRNPTARGVKQYSPAFERNCVPIARALERALAGVSRVLEIGSGSGQHVAWFAEQFPRIVWQPSELPANLESIQEWTREAGVNNVMPPLSLDVLSSTWPEVGVDAIVTINTLHIMPWRATATLFEHASSVLPTDGVLFVYGPFRFRDRALEPSNIRFDEWLHAEDPERGLREFESVDEVAVINGFVLVDEVAMPANNRAAWWRRKGS